MGHSLQPLEFQTEGWLSGLEEWGKKTKYPTPILQKAVFLFRMGAEEKARAKHCGSKCQTHRPAGSDGCHHVGQAGPLRLSHRFCQPQRLSSNRANHQTDVIPGSSKMHPWSQSCRRVPLLPDLGYLGQVSLLRFISLMSGTNPPPLRCSLLPGAVGQCPRGGLYHGFNTGREQPFQNIHSDTSLLSTLGMNERFGPFYILFSFLYDIHTSINIYIFTPGPEQLVASHMQIELLNVSVSTNRVTMNTSSR